MPTIGSRIGVTARKAITGGEAVVRALEAEGVKAVFGIPGVHNLPIYDALAQQSSIRHYLPRHEQGAGFMADGYARCSGQVGVAITTTGPGVTNCLTALANAYADSSPVVLITTTTSSRRLQGHRGALHELKDQHRLLEATTQAAVVAERPEEIPSKLKEAIRLARGGRPRPVSLEIPVDVLEDRLDGGPEQTASRTRHDSSSNGTVPANLDGLVPRGEGTPGQALEAAVDMLCLARHPLIYAGGGVVSSGAAGEVKLLAELLRAPVMTSLQARGVIPADHHLSLGTSWRLEPAPHTHPELLERVDVALAVGTALDWMNTANWTLRLPRDLIRVDVDPEELHSNYPAQVGLLGDAKVVLADLIARLRDRGCPGSAWDVSEIERTSAQMKDEGRRMSPRAFDLLDRIHQGLGDRGVIAADSTIASFWALRYYRVSSPRSLLFSGIATLGFALPVAIGAKAACPHRPIAALVGDGGFLFTAEELATAVEARLPLPIILINDRRFGMIKYVQKDKYNGRYIAVDLSNPDFVKLAEAFGAQAHRVDNLETLPETIANALRSQGPTLIEVPLALDPPIF